MKKKRKGPRNAVDDAFNVWKRWYKQQMKNRDGMTREGKLRREWEGKNMELSDNDREAVDKRIGKYLGKQSVKASGEKEGGERPLLG